MERTYIERCSYSVFVLMEMLSVHKCTMMNCRPANENEMKPKLVTVIFCSCGLISLLQHPIQLVDQHEHQLE